MKERIEHALPGAMRVARRLGGGEPRDEHDHADHPA